MSPENLEKTLRIPAGSNAEIRVYLTGDNDEFLDLSQFTSASFEIIDVLGSAGTVLVSRSSVEISIQTNYLSVDGISSAEWQDISVGLYIADVALFEPDGGQSVSDLFYVEVVDSVNRIGSVS